MGYQEQSEVTVRRLALPTITLSLSSLHSSTQVTSTLQGGWRQLHLGGKLRSQKFTAGTLPVPLC